MDGMITDYRKKVESLENEKKAYEKTLEDFLNRYMEEFKLGKERYTTLSLKRLNDKGLNPEFLKNGVEYMLSNREPITVSDISDAIGLDSRLQRYFLRDFIDEEYLLSPRKAGIIKEYFTTMDGTSTRFFVKKERFQKWNLANKPKAEQYVKFLEEL